MYNSTDININIVTEQKHPIITYLNKLQILSEELYRSKPPINAMLYNIEFVLIFIFSPCLISCFS